MKLTIDFETRSKVDLRGTNAWAYAEDPSTDVICLAWKTPSRPADCWLNEAGSTRGNFFSGPLPGSLEYWIVDTDCPIYAFNVAFEIAIWENIMVKRYGWPTIDLSLIHI